MIGGRLIRFKGKPWSRKSTSAIMRHTRVTTDAWLSTLDKTTYYGFHPGGPLYDMCVRVGWIFLVGAVFGTLIFLTGLL